MSGLDFVRDKPLRDELKSLRARLNQIEGEVTSLSASSGKVAWYEQESEPLVSGAGIAFWDQKSSGRLRVWKYVKATGKYDWVRVIKA